MSSLNISKKTWINIQHKAFVRWINLQLQKAENPTQVADLSKDLSNGVCLNQLMVVLSRGKYSHHFNPRPKFRIHYVDNISVVLEYLKADGVQFHSIGAEDILEGNLKLILGLIWGLILKYTLSDFSESQDFSSVKKSLLKWCQSQTRQFDTMVRITDLSTSWNNGIAICALLSSVRPDLLDFYLLDFTNKEGNTKKALKIATELGIPQLVDAEDLLVDKPDEKVLVTYLLAWYEKFNGQFILGENTELESEPVHLKEEKPVQLIDEKKKQLENHAEIVSSSSLRKKSFRSKITRSNSAKTKVPEAKSGLASAERSETRETNEFRSSSPESSFRSGLSEQPSKPEIAETSFRSISPESSFRSNSPEISFRSISHDTAFRSKSSDGSLRSKASEISFRSASQIKPLPTLPPHSSPVSSSVLASGIEDSPFSPEQSPEIEVHECVLMDTAERSIANPFKALDKSPEQPEITPYHKKLLWGKEELSKFMTKQKNEALRQKLENKPQPATPEQVSQKPNNPQFRSLMVVFAQIFGLKGEYETRAKKLASNMRTQIYKWTNLTNFNELLDLDELDYELKYLEDLFQTTKKGYMSEKTQICLITHKIGHLMRALGPEYKFEPNPDISLDVIEAIWNSLIEEEARYMQMVSVKSATLKNHIKRNYLDTLKVVNHKYISVKNDIESFLGATKEKPQHISSRDLANRVEQVSALIKNMAHLYQQCVKYKIDYKLDLYEVLEQSTGYSILDYKELVFEVQLLHQTTQSFGKFIDNNQEALQVCSEFKMDQLEAMFAELSSSPEYITKRDFRLAVCDDKHPKEFSKSIEVSMPIHQSRQGYDFSKFIEKLDQFKVPELEDGPLSSSSSLYEHQWSESEGHSRTSSWSEGVCKTPETVYDSRMGRMDVIVAESSENDLKFRNRREAARKMSRFPVKLQLPLDFTIVMEAELRT